MIALLNANAALKDGTAWLDSTRSNDLLPSTVSDITALGTMVSALRQTQTPSGAYLSLRPAWLLVPSAIEVSVATLVESAGKAGEIAVASDPRFTHSFLLPPVAENPVIGVVHLRGERGPTTAVARRPRTDDYSIKAMLDFAVAPVSTHAIRRELTV